MPKFLVDLIALYRILFKNIRRSTSITNEGINVKGQKGSKMKEECEEENEGEVS